MVKDAQEDGITDIDFTRKITLVGTAGKDASEKFLNLADFNKLIALAKSRANIKAITEYMIVTQAYTGMRFEEVLGLSWDRIDFDNLTIK
ncbi:tyrosine-type recombinase/integrase [Lacticaseibacillus saniviri]|nr:tyrosine-type recombinase/integrase [Lacticaseibacillus saniviri]